MNAEKIEVGDVWKNKYDGSLCHIISVKKDEVTYFCKKDMEIWISSIPHFWFLGWCKLVGKSKVGIEDLFKTEE